MNINAMDLHGIDLNLLVAFDALMAECSVTRAGARIGRTQPAMSAALARLRALLKDELLVRGPDGLQPTPRALDLAGPLGQALADIQRTLDFTQSFDPATSPATFTLGLPDHPALKLLPRLVEAIRQEAPLAGLRIRSFTGRDEALQLLDAGEVDATIGVPITGVTGGRILSLPLFEERFVCILRKGHPAATGGALPLEAYAGLPHLLVSPENERYGLVDAALARLGLKRTLALTVQQMHVAPHIVASSDLVATLMEGVVTASGLADRLIILPPPLELPKIPFQLVWHRRNDAHPGQRWLRSRIAALVKS